MQEQRRFRQQPLRRAGFLDDNRIGYLLKMLFFFPRQFLSGVDDDRKVITSKIRLQLLDQLEAGHVGQFQIQHHAVKSLVLQNVQCFLTGGHCRGFNIAIPDQLNHAHALNVVVLNHQ